MHRRFRITASLAGVFLCVLAADVSANDAMITYRQSVMKALGGHTAALAELVKGDVPFAANAKGHVEAISALSPMAATVFPEGSGKGGVETWAVPAIWEKPEAFKKQMAAMQEATDAMAKAYAADPKPAAIASAFGTFVKTCKSCHDDFKRK
jgi:cytochrome c556